MARSYLLAFSAALFLLLDPSVQAIVTSDLATSETDPSTIPEYSSFDWSGVYRHPDGSAVAVDTYWLLTAAHVADYGGAGTITSGGTTYYQQEIVYNDNNADLALIRYDKAFPDFYSLFTGDLTLPGSREVSGLLVGYGNTGTVSTVSWSDSGSGRNTQRWGSQVIDTEATVTYDLGGVQGSTTNSGFWMNFTASDTTYEAGVGTYDSGGGMFVDDGGEWKLAGINTARAGQPGAYTSTFSIAVQDYSGWINQTVPEPTMAILIGFAGFISLLAYRFRRNCR